MPLCYTYCQVPVIYNLSDKEAIEVVLNNGSTIKLDSLSLNDELSTKMFDRTGEIKNVNVFVVK